MTHNTTTDNMDEMKDTYRQRSSKTGKHNNNTDEQSETNGRTEEINNKIFSNSLDTPEFAQTSSITAQEKPPVDYTQVQIIVRSSRPARVIIGDQEYEPEKCAQRNRDVLGLKYIWSRYGLPPRHEGTIRQPPASVDGAIPYYRNEGYDFRSPPGFESGFSQFHHYRHYRVIVPCTNCM
jgi:hypothetical protein